MTDSGQRLRRRYETAIVALDVLRKLVASERAGEYLVSAGARCVYCDGHDARSPSAGVEHHADCPISQGRALIAASDPPVPAG